MRLDDVWLQTTLNTPNISGVWQIKKWSLVATFLVSLVLGFGGNVTASSDKSDQRLSGNDFIKSFSLHQLKKADNHDTQCLICQYKSSCRTIECFTIQHLINCPGSIYRRINQQIFKTTITPQLSNRCNIAG